MTALVWDAIGTKTFESGIEKAVIYTSSGIAIPWNGVTSIQENFEINTSPVYFDGKKISDHVELSDYSATIKAVTYPTDLALIEGYGSTRSGVLISDQVHETFNFSYKTNIGNNIDNDAGYKIHIIYNVTAVHKDVDYSSVSDSINFSEFEWDITAVPEELDFYRPTCHIIIDSTKIQSDILLKVENVLYGTSTNSAYLPLFSELMEMLEVVKSIFIVDNNDGTFTVETLLEGVIVYGSDLINDPVTINQANTATIDSVSYYLSDTLDGGAELGVVTFSMIGSVGNELWSATTLDSNAITLYNNGTFRIKNTDATFINPYTWRIT